MGSCDSQGWEKKEYDLPKKQYKQIIIIIMIIAIITTTPATEEKQF